jgi:DNA-directed RNA polymerase alpha subunit
METHDMDHAVVGPERKKFTSRKPKHRKVQRNPEPRAGQIRSGAPTGTTPHFKMWMADLNLKRALERTKLKSITAKHTDPVLINAYALLESGGFKTVWKLTQADARDLLRVKGIGPAKLEKVKADLAARNVAVRW